MNVCSFFYMSIFFKKTNILEHLRPPGDQRHREGERDDFFQDNLQENGDYHMIITWFNQRNDRICWFPRKLDAWTWLTWLYVINEHMSTCNCFKLLELLSNDVAAKKRHSLGQSFGNPKNPQRWSMSGGSRRKKLGGSYGFQNMDKYVNII